MSQIADLPQILELLRSKAEFDGGVELMKATPEQIGAALFGAHPRAAALVADVDGKLVGIATFFETFSTFLAEPCLWLDDLFVDSKCRSRGVGRLMLVELARIAVQRGAKRIDWTVAASNVRGQQFYERAGAKLRKNSLVARLDEPAIRRLAGADSPTGPRANGDR
jgi:GNAT superfamily N-acetyltransferase